MALSCGGAERISLSISIHDQIYTGPSFCAQDLLISPLCFVLALALLAARTKQVLKLPQAHDYVDPTFWLKLSWNGRIQFFLIVVVILIPIACIFMLSSSDPTSSRQVHNFISPLYITCLVLNRISVFR